MTCILLAADSPSSQNSEDTDLPTAAQSAAASAAEAASLGQHFTAVPAASYLADSAAAALPHLAALGDANNKLASYNSKNLAGNVLPPHVPSHLGSRVCQVGVAGASATSQSRPVNNAPAMGFHPISKDEVLLRVSVFAAKDPKRRFTFTVLGSQPLSALKDKVYCREDFPPSGRAPLQASYFYIEGVCYDDTRPVPVQCDGEGHILAAGTAPGQGGLQGMFHPPRLSKPVVDWSRSALRRRRPSGWGLVQSGDMAATRFEQLSVRIGAHYMYLHAGDCQHIVVFTDIRAAHSGDEQNALQYPIEANLPKLARQACQSCKQPANAVVLGDTATRSNPCYLCEACYRCLHSNSGAAGAAGEAGNFSMYRYFHD